MSTQVPRLLGAAAARLPGTLALAAVAVLLFGLLPWEATDLAWSAVALAGVITVFGPPLQWPAWTMDISPFTQTPKLPGGTVPAQPLLWLCGITLALAIAGLAGLRHRDIGDLGPSRVSCLIRDWVAGDTHQSNELSPPAAARDTAQQPGTPARTRPYSRRIRRAEPADMRRRLRLSQENSRLFGRAGRLDWPSPPSRAFSAIDVSYRRFGVRRMRWAEARWMWSSDGRPCVRWRERARWSWLSRDGQR